MYRLIIRIKSLFCATDFSVYENIVDISIHKPILGSFSEADVLVMWTVWLAADAWTGSPPQFIFVFVVFIIF